MKKLIFPFFFLLSVFVFAQKQPQEATIESISVSSDQESYSVLIRGNRFVNVADAFFDNPPRLAIDFPDVKNRFSTKAFEPRENSYVSRIRSQEFFKEGKRISRVLVELKRPVGYEIKKEADIVTVRFTDAASKLSGSGQNQQTPVGNPASQGKKPASTTGNRNLEIVVGTEDLLEVNVFELPQFSGQHRVAGDGTISLPLIGSIEVRGLTKKQVEDKIAKALEAKYVNNASVSVTIKEYRSRQVSVLGAVRNPGAYYIISSRTLLQVLSEAGGLTSEAGNRCYIFRQGAGKIEIDLRDLLNNGNQELNVPVFPGDVINIPVESKVVVYVLGAVRSPGAVEMTPSMPVTLLAAIARAGGPTEEANQSGIQIKRRKSDGTETVIKANLKDILKGKAEDVPLMSGDVVNVPESFF